MKDRKMTWGESVVFAFLFLGMFILVNFHEKLTELNLILPMIILEVVSFLGFFTWQIAKEWKKSDDAVLDLESTDEEDTPFGRSTRKPTFEDRRNFFFAAIGMVLFLLFKEKQVNTPSLIFCGVILVMACGHFLPALIQKLRGKEDEPFCPKSRLQPDQILQMLLSLFALCFACFWIYLVLSNTGLWWFSIPGFILAFAFARPLVAGLRILFRREKDPGEKHVRRKKDQDPWDRPDRQL